MCKTWKVSAHTKNKKTRNKGTMTTVCIANKRQAFLPQKFGTIIQIFAVIDQILLFCQNSWIFRPPSPILPAAYLAQLFINTIQHRKLWVVPFFCFYTKLLMDFNRALVENCSNKFSNKGLSSVPSRPAFKNVYSVLEKICSKIR